MTKKTLAAREAGPAMHAVMSAQAIAQWFETAGNGASVVYFAGCLSIARDVDDAVHAAALAAWQLASRGVVDLLQRRLERLGDLPLPCISTKGYEYLTVKRRNADRPLLGVHAPDEPEAPFVKSEAA